MYTKIELVDADGEPRFVLSGEPEDTEDVPQVAYHEIPLYAIANRMELYGFESVEQTLEYIGREVSDAEVADTLHGPIQEAYNAVAQAEFAQTLMAKPLVDSVSRQTFMEPMAIGSTRRETLQRVRDESVRKIRMSSVAHSEPMIRLMDATRPVERTRPAAAEALGAVEGVIAEAVSMVQDLAEDLTAMRADTFASYVPALRKKHEEQEIS